MTVSSPHRTVKPSSLCKSYTADAAAVTFIPQYSKIKCVYTHTHTRKTGKKTIKLKKIK